MRVFVTGGAGYIGSVTAAELIGRGHEVVVYDNLEKGHREAVPAGATLVVGDLADGGRVEEALRRQGAEAVIHFAGYSLVGESVAHPGRYFRNNVGNGLNLLGAMRRAGTSRIIFSSTAAVYGSPRAVPITEEEPAAPINPYGESKRFFETALSRFHAAYGWDCVSLRYFNAAGATAALGEDHDPETHLIPIVLRAALDGRGGVDVFGDDYDTPDGTCVRDYIHVTDLAAAHVLALECGGDRAYNVGVGRGYSVLEVIEAARRVTGARIEARAAPRRPGDPPALVASAERIRRELGWSPRRDGIEGIVESAWRWMREHPGGYGGGGKLSL
ncbi:MAG: UDP-glucose 4-epimerase GalE [bacterium]|nr:UDP-glucose 4-epimerase GalE [bacterium]